MMEWFDMLRNFWSVLCCWASIARGLSSLQLKGTRGTIVYQGREKQRWCDSTKTEWGWLKIKIRAPRPTQTLLLELNIYFTKLIWQNQATKGQKQWYEQNIYWAFKNMTIKPLIIRLMLIIDCSLLLSCGTNTKQIKAVMQLACCWSPLPDLVNHKQWSQNRMSAYNEMQKL